MGPADPRRASLAQFNARGGKLRVAITARCNLDCFFCHNEGMPNPRRGEAVAARLDDDALVGVMNAWTALGGAQLNVTGGEPLLHAGLWELLARVERRGTRVILNTNGLLAERLLDREGLAPVDALFVSLHTTDENVFGLHLLRTPGRGRGASGVMRAIERLRARGYRVQLNLSLGDYNRTGFDDVLAFARAHGVDLKIIALIRSDARDGFYGGPWIDPRAVEERLAAAGATVRGTREGFGGFTTKFALDGISVEVKNVARGRLRTSFCDGCAAETLCGEGMYALRVGVDGWMRPCLLRRDGFRALEPARAVDEQLLDAVHAMVGAPEAAHLRAGALS